MPKTTKQIKTGSQVTITNKKDQQFTVLGKGKSKKNETELFLVKSNCVRADGSLKEFYQGPAKIFVAESSELRRVIPKDKKSVNLRVVRNQIPKLKNVMTEIKTPKKVRAY